MLTQFKIRPPKFLRFLRLPTSKRKRLILISTALSIFIMVTSITIASKYVVHGIDYNVPIEGETQRQILIATHYIDIDTTLGTLTADWYPSPYDNCPTGENVENPEEEVVNIYLDHNVLKLEGGDANKADSDNPPDQPTFQFNTTRYCYLTVRDSYPTFRTVAKLIDDQWDPKHNDKWIGSSLKWYPWDRYYSRFSLFAKLNSTNASVGLITDKPLGSPINFEVNLLRNYSTNSATGLYLVLDVTRSPAVRVFVVCIIFANWLTTLALLWITVASFLWPEEVVKEVFVVPIGALFAITSIRANMPGAPSGFGTYVDFVGILPNIILMAIFSATLLLVILFRRTRSNREGDKLVQAWPDVQAQDQEKLDLELDAESIRPFLDLEKVPFYVAGSTDEGTLYLSPEQNKFSPV